MYSLYMDIHCDGCSDRLLIQNITSAIAKVTSDTKGCAHGELRPLVNCVNYKLQIKGSNLWRKKILQLTEKGLFYRVESKLADYKTKYHGFDQ